MRILIVGGTRFVGRYITDAALQAGHQVTLLHRGKTGAGLFPQATHLLGDRNKDLRLLRSGDWDATVDVNAYRPRQVRSLAHALDGRGGRHLLHLRCAVADAPMPAVVIDLTSRNGTLIPNPGGRVNSWRHSPVASSAMRVQQVSAAALSTARDRASTTRSATRGSPTE